MLHAIIASGFGFLKNLNNTETVYENKFTGLRIVYNAEFDTYTVIDD